MGAAQQHVYRRYEAFVPPVHAFRLMILREPTEPKCLGRNVWAENVRPELGRARLS
jgi:hypothetical protein